MVIDTRVIEPAAADAAGSGQFSGIQARAAEAGARMRIEQITGGARVAWEFPLV